MDILTMQIFTHLGRSLADTSKEGRVASGFNPSDSCFDPLDVTCALSRDYRPDVMVVDND